MLHDRRGVARIIARIILARAGGHKLRREHAIYGSGAGPGPRDAAKSGKYVGISVYLLCSDLGSGIKLLAENGSG